MHARFAKEPYLAISKPPVASLYASIYAGASGDMTGELAGSGRHAARARGGIACQVLYHLVSFYRACIRLFRVALPLLRRDSQRFPPEKVLECIKYIAGSSAPAERE